MDIQKELSQDDKNIKIVQDTKKVEGGKSLRPQSAATVKNSFLRKSVDYQKERSKKEEKIVGGSLRNSFDKNSTSENNRVNFKMKTER